MDDHPTRHPRCIIIAGPNGSGKTTFAKEYLLREVGIIHFVNADLIAGGLSPLRPELAARQAGRLVLRELTRLADARKNFAFESTLSGRTYLRLLTTWKSAGYRIEIVFLSLPSVQLALQRIAGRVRQGGHDVLRSDVIRRYDRSWKNFHDLYRPLADGWAMYDNSGSAPQLVERAT
ncbi:MAG: AAA family ATPase [Nitrospira sp.]|nr:AAA family ATPase [Nitrospira sp.]